ncbi:RNA polymerase sigma factor [Actinophytocola sediminis]
MTTEGDLIDRLVAGDLTAWRELVYRNTALVWVVARSYRLDQVDAADAVQHTWLALAEHLPRLTTPERLHAWLVTTARRESLRIQERRARERPAAEVRELVGEHRPERRPDRDPVLRLAFAALPDRCRCLLALHANAPDLSYDQLAAALEMPPGSVGHTKSRCLAHLRRLIADYELAEPA